MHDKLLHYLDLCCTALMVGTSLGNCYGFDGDQGQRNPKRLHIALWSGQDGWALRSSVCDQIRSQDIDDCSARLEVEEDDRVIQEGEEEVEKEVEKEEEEEETQEEEEGIALSVINQRDGRLLLREIFPLHNYWSYWVDLLWHMQRISPGRIVAMSVSKGGCVGLRQSSKHLAKMGSLFAEHLTPSAHWIWVFVKGGKTLSETAAIEGRVSTCLETQTVLRRQQPIYKRLSDSLEKDRWKFCDKEEGLGDLCDEFSPTPLPIQIPPKLSAISTDALKSVPIIVTAGKRFRYLNYTLKKILSAPGVDPDNLLVVLGDTSRQTMELLYLLHVNYITLPSRGTDNTQLFHYYRNVYSFIAQTFNDSQNVIMMDEDVEVSPDFFSFMSQTMWLLQQDPSIYCISGHGKHKNISYDFKKVLRGRSMVAWGYAVSVVFVKEALKLWMNVSKDADDFYDLWLFEHAAKGMDCIFPDVSRTKHYGIGINTVPFQTESFFQAIPLVKDTGVHLENTERLILPLWKQDLTESIKRAETLRGHPCSESFIPEVTRPTTYVFYVEMTEISDGWPDCWNFYKLLKCLGAWDLTPFSTVPHGLHEGVATFTLSPNATVHAVGVPYSSYSYLRHPSIKPWSAIAREGEYEMFRAGFAFPSPMKVRNQNMTSDMLMKILTLDQL